MSYQRGNTLLKQYRWTIGYGLLLFLRLFVVSRIQFSSALEFPLERIFSLIQWFFIVVLAGGLGSYIQNRFLRDTSKFISIVEVALGFGILSASFSILGFIQFLSPGTVQGLTLVLGVFFGKHCNSFYRVMVQLFQSIPKSFRTANLPTKVLIIAFASISILTLINTLTPPWDYDGLMYHLLGPQQFLDVGGIFPNLDNWYVNGPFAIEMLFTMGLSIQDDVLPKLLHYSFWILLSLATFEFGKRWYSDEVGMLSLAIILGVPALPIWASFAYIDIAWALFEFLAFASLLAWFEESKSGWLLISGIFIGFAIGAKYLGLFGALAIGLLLLFFKIQRNKPIHLRDLITFGLPVVIIASPWYFKNLIMFGNPVYPLIWGGPAWDATRISLYNAYLNSFGRGNGIIDFLKLPYDVYAHNEAFGAVMNRNDIPNILFIFAPLGILLTKDKLARALTFICAVRILLWFPGSQQLRFLLPIYPIFAIISSLVMVSVGNRLQRLKSINLFFTWLSVGLVFIPIFYQVQIIRVYRSVHVLLGQITREQFLEEAVGDYVATRFIQEELPETTRVLMLGNGRGYYCAPKCLPDPDHFHRARQLIELDESMSIGEWLRREGASHLLVSIEDLDFLLQHDPEQIMLEAYEILKGKLEAPCLDLVHKDKWTEIYSHNCID